MLPHRVVFLTFAVIVLFVAGCGAAGGGDDTGKVTKANVLKVTNGMSIDDAKLILGPPTHETKLETYHKMEWGSPGISGLWIVLDYDKDSLKITRKKVIGMD